jgi:predicted aconitase with swiveling domain
MRHRAKILVPGSTSGEIAALQAALSLWGGFDPITGIIIDRNHPDFGLSLRGKIVLMSYARGSSSSSSVLLEAARTGRAPAAFILNKSDPILTIGALVVAELYQRDIPVLVISSRWDMLASASHASFAAARGNQECVIEAA